MQQVLKPSGVQKTCDRTGHQGSSIPNKALCMLELQAAQKEDIGKITAWAQQTQGYVDTIPPGHLLTVPTKLLSRSLQALACLKLAQHKKATV